jgi:hypothetical protein
MAAATVAASLAFVPWAAFASPAPAPAAGRALASRAAAPASLFKKAAPEFKAYRSSSSVPGRLGPSLAKAGVNSAKTIYVGFKGGGILSCPTETGNGTAASPYCSIQDAVNAAASGDTVSVSSGNGYSYTESVTVRTSGISIVGTGNPVVEPIVQSGGGPAFDIDGASGVSISGLTMQGQVEIVGSSDVTLDSDYVTQYGSPAITIDGASSHITVSRTYTDTYHLTKSAPAITVASGAANITLASDLIAGTGITATGVSGLDIVGNTIQRGCASGVDVEGTSTAVYLENNLIEDPDQYDDLNETKTQCTDASQSWSPDVTVSSGSTAGTTADYNDFYMNSTDATDPYSWAGTAYSTLSAFQTGATQGAHDTLDSKAPSDFDLRGLNPSTIDAQIVAGSAAIGSANVSAPGELSSDFEGVGPYNCRGAIQLTPDTLSETLSATYGGGYGVDVVASVSSGGVGITNYLFSWGDGTQTDAQDSAVHIYKSSGTYTVQVTATDVNGFTVTTSIPVTIVYTSDNLTASLDVTPSSAYGFVSDGSASTGNAVIDQYAYDWGDGNVTFGNTGSDHKYAKLGTYPVTLTVTDLFGQTASTSVEVTTAGSDYTAYGPTRLLDTRSGIGAPTSPVPANGTVKIQVGGYGGSGGIPQGVTAVVLNITVTDAHGSGFITAYDDGDPNGIPSVSNVNYQPNQTVPNLAIVPVGVDGKVDLTNGGGLAGNVDLIADVTGYFTESAASGYTSLTPDRLVDTRNGTGAPKAQVGQNGKIAVQIAGADGGQLPASGINAVALNVTVTDTNGDGFLTAYQDGSPLPNASNVNYGKGQTIANSVIVPVGSDGEIDITNSGGQAKGVDIVVDVVGYYSLTSTSAYIVAVPTRFLDTRDTADWTDGPLENGNLNYIPLTIGVNDDTDQLESGVTGIVMNMTVTDTKGNGFLTVAPDPNYYYQYLNGSEIFPTPPNSSSLNWLKGETVPNLVQVSAGNTGIIDVWNLGTPAGSADLIVDAFGYYQNT